MMQSENLQILSLESVSSEIIDYTFQYLDFNSALQFSKTNKRYKEIYDNSLFWKLAIDRLFEVFFDDDSVNAVVNQKNKMYKQKYRELYNTFFKNAQQKIFRDLFSNDFNNSKNSVFKTIYCFSQDNFGYPIFMWLLLQNRMDLISFVPAERNCIQLLRNAAKCGHFKLFSYLIEHPQFQQLNNINMIDEIIFTREIFLYTKDYKIFANNKRMIVNLVKFFTMKSTDIVADLEKLLAWTCMSGSVETLKWLETQFITQNTKQNNADSKKIFDKTLTLKLLDKDFEIDYFQKVKRTSLTIATLFLRIDMMRYLIFERKVNPFENGSDSIFSTFNQGIRSVALSNKGKQLQKSATKDFFKLLQDIIECEKKRDSNSTEDKDRILEGVKAIAAESLNDILKGASNEIHAIIFLSAQSLITQNPNTALQRTDTDFNDQFELRFKRITGRIIKGSVIAGIVSMISSLVAASYEQIALANVLTIAFGSSGALGLGSYVMQGCYNFSFFREMMRPDLTSLLRRYILIEPDIENQLETFAEEKQQNEISNSNDSYQEMQLVLNSNSNENSEDDDDDEIPLQNNRQSKKLEQSQSELDEIANAKLYKFKLLSSQKTSRIPDMNHNNNNNNMSEEDDYVMPGPSQSLGNAVKE